MEGSPYTSSVSSQRTREPVRMGSAALSHGHSLIKVCVSGAAETGHCGIEAYEMGKEVGREIARHGAVITSGATTGFPLYAAIGAKEAGGISIGLSPAASEREHAHVYQLPLEYMDVVVYTGFGYSGRNLMLVRSSDAVVIGCGRIGTINEFTIAYEDMKPVGILEGAWKTDEVIHTIINEANRTNPRIIFDSDPKALVERLIELVRKDKTELNLVYNNHDGVGGKGDLIM